MKKDLFHSTIDTIIDRGVRKAERKFVRNLIDKDYKIEEISNLLDLDEDYILYLLD